MPHIFFFFSPIFVKGGKVSFQGLNGPRSIMPGTPLAITGNAGDVVYVSMQGVTAAKLDQGICVQAVRGTVKYYVTLQDPKQACNPNEIVQKSISWANETTAQPGSVVLLDTPCITCIKLEFQEDASFYIYAR